MIAQHLSNEFKLPVTIHTGDDTVTTVTPHGVRLSLDETVPLGPGLHVGGRRDIDAQQHIAPMPSPESVVPAPGVGLRLANLGLPPHRSLANLIRFPASFVLNYRFYVIFMARTLFQLIRPLLAFCVFGEVMKLALAMLGSGPFVFGFSFILAFEVLYFFLQCYISYVFLGMFFTASF